MNELEILLIGTVGTCTVYWQIREISPENDLYELMHAWDLGSPNKFLLPFITGVLTFIGYVYYCAVGLIEKSIPSIHTLPDCLPFLLKGFFVPYILIIKTYFGPVVLGYVLCYSIYSLFEKGQLQYIPVFSEAVDWMFSKVSEPIHILYTFLLFLYVSIVSLIGKK